ncbi:MAG: peroxide stress protein YaaA [Marinilabiliaceae bacterium]|nr:peroxide stress protein YaaA [Marinilabiliaceae bacterium]
MIAILSPAKNISSQQYNYVNKLSNPRFINETNELVYELKKFSVDEISKLFQVNDSIAHLNFNRFQSWDDTSRYINAAIHAFTGEVYRGLNAKDMTEDELSDCNNKIRILSGLYGILRPLDAIQPYRLEMGTPWGGKNHSSLYHLWTDRVTEELNRDIEKSSGEKVLINLASNEYIKVVNKKKFNYPILSVDFKQEENGKLKTVVVYTKRARGLMARFIIDFKITKSDDLKGFNYEGYNFNSEYSTTNKWVFTR